MKIETTITALRALALFAPTTDPRSYLIGVHVRATSLETWLEATDGHALGVYRTEAENQVEETVSVIVPLGIIKMLKSFSKTVDTVFLTQESEGWIAAPVTGAAVRFTPVEGTFPIVKQIVPKTLSNEPAQFNPELLGRFQKAAKLFGSKLGLIHVAYNGRGTSMVYLDNVSPNEFVGLIMPLRGEIVETRSSVPTWPAQPLPLSKETTDA